MRHGSLFSGIGGFDLAAEWMGWENVFHCERDEFCSRVLKYHFPRSISYGDIKQTDFSVHRGEIDIISGGFPCQPYSGAGKRLGKEDDRHLWPEMLRAIREVAPRFVVGENVRGLLNWNGGVVLDEIYADLEAEGYEVGTFVLPAVGINAPHRRERVWIIAHRADAGTQGVRQQREDAVYGSVAATHTNSEEREWRSGAGEQEWQEAEQRRDGVQRTATRLGEVGNAPHANGYGLEGGLSSDLDKQPSNTGEYDAQYLREGAGSQGIPFEEFPTQSPICGGDDGLPRELDNIAFPKWKRESIKAYGNAIVPQVALQIFKVIYDIA